MTKKMVVQSYLAGMMEEELKPVFKAIDEAWKDGKMTTEEWANIKNLEAVATVKIDDKALTAMEVFGADTGVDVRTSDKSLTGISASVSAMSEDTANTMGGYLNMGLMQWTQQTALQTQILAALREQDKPLTNVI